MCGTGACKIRPSEVLHGLDYILKAETKGARGLLCGSSDLKIGDGREL